MCNETKRIYIPGTTVPLFVFSHYAHSKGDRHKTLHTSKEARAWLAEWQICVHYGIPSLKYRLTDRDNVLHALTHKHGTTVGTELGRAFTKAKNI